MNQSISLADKRKQLARLLQEAKPAVSASASAAINDEPVLAAGPRPQRLPLSYAQARLWLLDQLEPGSTMYIISTALQLSGVLRVDLLEAAINEIVRRHEALRTIFLHEQGRPYQVVQPFWPIQLPVIEIEPRDGQSLDELALQRAQALAQQPIDLAAGPLFRVTLLRKSEHDHTLALDIHHIISDAWSFKLFTQELATLYADFARGEPASLPALSVQYADYCVWEQQWLRGKRVDEPLAYWKQQLAGELPVIQLPTDRPRQPKLTYRGALHRFYLPRLLVDGLKSFSQQAEVTPFMTLLAAFQTLLHRYTGQADMLVGSAFAGRNQHAVNDLIGFFVNTLPLRVSLAGEPSFTELLGRVREAALGAYAHQDIPFIQLVEHVRPDRDTSHTPLVQVMFVLRQKAPAATYSLPELTLGRPREIDGGVARFELTWSMEEEDDDFLVQVEYNADLFDAARIERLGGHFVTLLGAAMERPSQPIATLALLTEVEQQRLLGEWNRPSAPPSDVCFHRLFEARAKADPDQVAVVCGDERLTYAELDTRATRLARQLRGQGVGRDVLVGLCLERSVSLVTAILAVFKAGGAYLPIDPGLPTDRVAFLVDDARLSLVLVQAQTRELVAALPSSVSMLDVETVDHSGPVDQLGDDGESSSQLAYVIYTSGSTGKPKGVEVEHAGLHNLLEAQQTTFGVTRSSRVLQFASISFDASIFEIVMALGSGATLVISPHLTVGAKLLELLEREAITHATLPPSVLANMPHAPLPALQTIITAGEACPAFLVDRWAGGRGFFNAYGPTEATVWSTVAQCNAGERVTIGRPIRNTQVYLLDQALQPVPVGVPGEMYIGGAGLARGYLGRPELTAQRVIQSPFASPGTRLYRTGDIARHLEDGSIDFLGRTDDQVKVRGFRIELEEIEKALLQHPAVQEAAVLVKGDALEDRQLVAFYVSGESGAMAAELRAFLKRTLPSYMVPSAFVAMPSFPLTNSNKVDRQALARLDVVVGELGGYQAPTNAVEETIAAVWAEVLKRERVGIHDNFFELGGHSLQATQVVSRLGEAFAQNLPLAALFEQPTVAELARLIEEEGASSQHALPAPIATIGAGASRLSFAQERLWIHDAVTQEQAAYNIPTVLDLRGPLDHDVLRGCLVALVLRHEALRTEFVSADGVPQQVITDKLLACPVIDLRELPPPQQEAEMQRLALEEARYAFDLAAEWPVRAMLVCRGADHHVLLLTIHHIAADDRSMRILLRDLQTLYAAAAQGVAPALPPLPVRYRDFAEWQRQRLAGDRLDEQLTYWRQQLADLPQPATLIADFTRSTARNQAADSVSQMLPPAALAALERVGREEQCTLFMLLLGAWQTVLYRYTGQEDLLVGTSIANRDRRELEHVVGYFGNTLVLRTDLSGHPTFRELLARVKKTALGAFQHAEIPFEEVIDKLGLARDIGNAPPFRILFGLQDPSPLPSHIGDAALTASQTDNKMAKFDLVVLVGPREGGLELRLQYDTQLFRRDTIERVTAHFRRVLEELASHLDQPLDALPLLTEAEQQARRAWNATTTDYPQHAGVHELFEAQVQRTPDATAVVWGNRRLSYRQLNQQANQLAHHLRRLGVGLETLVGLYLDRSPEWVISILAVLKAGAAFVPVDPTYPQDRIAFMLSDAQVPVLLTHGATPAGLASHMARIVDVGSGNTALALEPDDNPSPLARGENLAYVMFTSGSTGRPKGVQIPHRAINRLVFNTNYITLGPDDRVAQGSNGSFDGITFELWAALLHGGQLVGFEKDVMLSPHDLAAQLQEQGITVLFLTTALFNLMATTVPDGLRSLHDVIIGGEAVDCECVRAMLREGPPQRFVHIYGPTECTAWSTWHLVREVPDNARTIPIGAPVSNDQVYVLDAMMRPAPVGVPGEIYIGGAGLARGYHNRPELTAERFVRDPFSEAPDARLYKTGDMGRYLPDGQIEFIERRDEQVKLRGYRIELSEIEAALCDHPGVGDAVVVARQDVPGHKRLVAFVVSCGSEAIRAGELRQHLAGRLPSFMVPSDFVPMDALPLSPNGKIDRKRLAQQPLAPATREIEYVAPRSELEQAISQVWQEVLKLDSVGVHDNFFELGGSSLIVPQILSRLNQRLGERRTGEPLTAVSIFQYPSIAALARHLSAEAAAEPVFTPAATQDQANTRRASRARQAERRRQPAP